MQPALGGGIWQCLGMVCPCPIMSQLSPWLLLLRIKVWVPMVSTVAGDGFSPFQLYEKEWRVQRPFWLSSMMEVASILEWISQRTAEFGHEPLLDSLKAFDGLTQQQQEASVVDKEEVLQILCGCEGWKAVGLHIMKCGGFDASEDPCYALCAGQVHTVHI